MLGWWRSPGEVATYYLAGLFIGAMMTVVNVLTLVLTPYVSKISTMDQDYIRVRFQVLFRWFLHGATLLAVTVFFLVEPFVGLAFGPDYADAVPLFRMLLPVFVLRAGWVAYGIFAMNAYNLVKESVALSSLLGCAVLIFDLALIPSFGAPGAIAATFLAYGLTRVITLVTVAHMRRIVPMTSIARALGAAVLVVGSAHMLRPAGTPAALACGVAAPAVYCLALALLSELTRRDWEVVKMVAAAAWQPLAMAGHRS